jgi:hypothetical protein
MSSQDIGAGERWSSHVAHGNDSRTGTSAGHTFLRHGPRQVPKLETGNAHVAGAAARGWFVGDLAAWAAQRGAGFDAAGTLRQSDHVQVKWLVHPPGDERREWAEPDDSLTLSVLVNGDMRLEFRARGSEPESVRLSGPGDYVIWPGSEYSHWWRTEGGCTMITVRWPAEHVRVAG